DAAHLAGEVAGHGVHRIGQVLPDAGNPPDLGLAAKLALGADLQGHAGDLRGEGVELIDQDRKSVVQRQDFPTDVHRHLLAQVAVGDGGGDVGDVAHLPGQVTGHAVDAVRQVLPDAGDPPDVGLAAQPPLAADLAGHAGDLRGEGVELID